MIMKRTWIAGLLMLVPVYLLVQLYNFLPKQQGWVIFGAVAGLALARQCHCKDTKGGVA
jgi:uncharacterized membrane protein